ncbi:MAG TPA: preprotein translocase subunit SecE [Terracidiphilus sp.]|jgi:preprotein translocase subunit SecE
MATKAALVNGEQRSASGKLTPTKRQGPNADPNLLDRVAGAWKDLTHFLNDVRGEMHKVVTPSRKEVETTTTVVLVTVFLFGLFFFVADYIFQFGLDRLLKQLSGVQ